MTNQLERDLRVLLQQRAESADQAPTGDASLFRRARRRRNASVAGAMLVVAATVAVGGWAASSLLSKNDTLPAQPTHHGRIVLYAHGGDLVSVDSDGFGTQRLIHGAQGVSSFPDYAVSPDGTRLAYIYTPRINNISGSAYSLYVADADGSNVHRLTGCATGEQDCPLNPNSQLAWSPDGSQIAVAPGNDLYVVEVRSGERRTISLGPGAVDAAAWSPDGTRIAFGQGNRLRTVAPDGSEPRTLAAVPGPVSDVSWSPDGTMLVVSARDGLHVMNADGAFVGAVTVSSPREAPGTASWSPDGRSIAYLTTPHSASGYRADVWVVGPDGKSPRLVWRAPCCHSGASGPSWSPDGRSLAVTVQTHEGASGTLAIVDLEGTDVRQVDIDGGLGPPVWS